MLIARRTGGLSARPIGENAAPSTSDVTLDNIQLTAKLWGIDNRIPMSLFEDSVVDLADLMAVEVAQAFSEAFDNSGFIGTGTGATYHGTTGVAVAIIDGTHTAGVVNAKSGNTTFGGLELADFTNTVARLPVYARARGNAKWRARGGGQGVTKAQFLADRAPARFLFQLQWVQVGYSLGVNVTASAAVLSATTRNHDEPDIPQGRGQWHGGQTKLTASISVPFLDAPERKYKPFTGQGILTPIMAAQFPVFNRACERKMKRAVAAIARS